MQPKRINERLVLVYNLLLGLAVFFSSGCVSATSKQLAANFGAASAGVAAKTSALLSEVRQDQGKFKVATALRFSNTAADDGAGPPDIQIESLALRIALLDEMRQYGAALSELASDDELGRIDKASRDLFDALSSLNSTIGAQKKEPKAPLQEEELRVAATAVNIAGRWWFEHQRLNAMQTVTETAAPVISEAVDLILAEIAPQHKEGTDPAGQWEKSFQISLTTRGSTLYEIAQTSAAFDPSPDDPKNRSLATPKLGELSRREALIVEAQQLRTRAASLRTEFEHLAAALRQIKIAHSNLAAALKNDSEANVRQAVGSLSNLSGAVFRINAFYAALGKPSAKQ